MTRPILLFVCLVIFVLGAITIAKLVGVDQTAVASGCSAAAFIASALIAYRTLRLQLAQQEEPWMKTFRELHKEFWDDPDMAKVRSWIACDEAYKEIEEVLDKRGNGQVTKKQYESLEKVDKFCAFMIRVAKISSTTMDDYQKQIWTDLYYQYWLHHCHGRIKLAAYIRHYWPSLTPYLDAEDQRAGRAELCATFDRGRHTGFARHHGVAGGPGR